MKRTNIMCLAKRCLTSFQRFNSNVQPIKMNDLSPKLVDTFGRGHNYLRMSLTERCNLRCQYCMPEEGVNLTPKSHLLTTKEVVSVVSLFVKLGVTKVRFTGGEPLLRKDLTEIIKTVSQLDGLKTVGLTTNGLVLYRKIEELKDAGLSALNISLDSLIPAKFEFISRHKGLNLVMKSIHAALGMGFDPVKLNCVAMKGINDDELISFVQLSENMNVDVRFIEYCPFGGNKWNDNKMLPYAEMLKTIKAVYPDLKRLEDMPNDTSKAYKVPGYRGQIGFITSMTENFCSSCNRLRITADGNLKVCLFGNEEISLRDALRQNVSEDNLLDIISTAVLAKKKKHADEKKNKLMCHRISSAVIHRLYFCKLYRSFTPFHISRATFSTESSNPTKTIDAIPKEVTTEGRKNTLTHTTEEGELKMVDVSSKRQTVRVAEAEVRVFLGPVAFQLVEQNKIKKGDVLSTANLAGIMAAKRTSDLIPLCHNIQIDHVNIFFTLDSTKNEVHIKSHVKAVDKTGCEMEALTSATVAALTIYDMCKAVSRDITIHSARLLQKTGGNNDFESKVT